MNEDLSQILAATQYARFRIRILTISDFIER